MRKCFWLFLLVFLFVLSAKAMPARADDLQMVSEFASKPGISGNQDLSNSPVVSPGYTTISITFNEPIWITAYPGPDPPQTYMNAFMVSGQYDYGFFTASTGNTRLANNNTTLVLDNVDLPEDDTITVALREGIAPAGNNAADTFSFSFTTPAVTNIKMDPVLEQAIKTTLGIPDGREVYQSEDPYAEVPNPDPDSRSKHEPDFVPIPAMDDLTSLTYEYPETNQDNPLPQLSSISGLVYADNLKYLNLMGNNISDLTPLEGLNGDGLPLQQLYLNQNNISDITALSQLSSLQKVDLSSNPLDNARLAPLANLSSLTHLELNGCGISDQGLQGMNSSSSPSLTYLSLLRNNITNISPLQDLTGLTYLNLDHNQITDGAPISSLTNLTELDLDNNRRADGSGGLSDLGFMSNLASLQTLDLSVNNIVYLQPPQSGQSPFANLVNLQALNLSDNYIIDIAPLDGLTSLHNLDLSSNCLNDADLTILEGMTFQPGQDIKTSAAATITVAAGAAGDQNQPQISIYVAADTSKLDASTGKGMVTYTYEVTNPGSIPLGNVRPVDDKISPVTYVSGDDGNNSLDPGETWTYTAQAYLSETTTDTATATGYDNSNPGAGAAAAATITVAAGSAGDRYQPQISITKTAATSSLNGSGTGTVTYTYTVTNTGGVPLSNVAATDNQLGSLTPIYDYGEILSTGSYSAWTYTARANLSATATNTVTVTATIANSPAVNVSGNQDLDSAAYDNKDRLNDDYASIMMIGPANKGVSLPELTQNQFGNQEGIATILPSGGSPNTPGNEAFNIAGTTPIVLTYDFSSGGQPFDLKRLELGSYLSKVQIYINGKLDGALTKSLSFDSATATGDTITTVVLDHGVPFPNASTISVVVPARLSWYRTWSAD